MHGYRVDCPVLLANALKWMVCHRNIAATDHRGGDHSASWRVSRLCLGDFASGRASVTL